MKKCRHYWRKRHGNNGYRHCLYCCPVIQLRTIEIIRIMLGLPKEG